MARSDWLFKRSYNQALDRVKSSDIIVSLSQFARDLDVSRTTARKIVRQFIEQQILVYKTGEFVVKRQPASTDYYAEHEIRATEQKIELNFMNWILHDRVLPGTKISEAELVRRFDVSTSTIREFLIRLSRFGFIRKEPHHHWVLDGFSSEYAAEVMLFRRIFELRAIEHILRLPNEDIFWKQLEATKQDHLTLQDNIDRDFLRMPALDVEFHTLLSQASGGRLLPLFSEAVSLIFHYHYHHFWDERSRYRRALSAIDDHLQIIDALQMKKLSIASARMQKHLTNAQSALQETF